MLGSFHRARWNDPSLSFNPLATAMERSIPFLRGAAAVASAKLVGIVPSRASERSIPFLCSWPRRQLARSFFTRLLGSSWIVPSHASERSIPFNYPLAAAMEHPSLSSTPSCGDSWRAQSWIACWDRGMDRSTAHHGTIHPFPLLYEYSALSLGLVVPSRSAPIHPVPSLHIPACSE